MSQLSDEIAELHWRHDLMGSIEVGIVVIDRDYRVKVWNQFMENHSGKLPSQVTDKTLFECFDEIDADWFKIKTDPVFSLRSKAYIIWEQRPYLFKFGAKRPITSASDQMFQNVTIFPLASLTEEVEQICIVVYDVTDEATSKIETQALTVKLEQFSRVDGLTGIYNRRFWQDQFDMEFKRLKRSENSASLMMLDIDHFKQVNDQYGHPAGDQVIKSLANIIQKSIRETDISGRYGGEEFAILLPETNVKCASLVAERIRHLAESLTVKHDDVEITFTVSLGIAEFSTSFQQSMAWLEKADQALYQAKESGRNRVVVA